MTSLWFVTPAHGRYGLTDVCLAQRRWVADYLAEHGIDVHCVVVALDDNLDIARTYGFDTFRRNNEWLGRRFNDGMQYAGSKGADWVVPIGSDSWIHPDYFIPLPSTSRTRTSKRYSIVSASKMGELSVGGNGAGPYVFHRSLLAKARYRPANDKLKKSVDRSTVRGLPGISWEFKNVKTHQYIGFRGKPHISDWATLWRNCGRVIHNNHWKILEDYYPVELVGKVRSNAKQWLIP